MMRMDRVGLVENDVFANSLGMLADPITNVLRRLRLIIIHTAEFLKMPYEYYERLQMPLQIIQTSYKRLANEANVSQMLAELFSFVTYSQAL